MEITLAGILLPLGAWFLSGFIFLLFQCEGSGAVTPRCAFVSSEIASQIGFFYFTSMMAVFFITPVSTVAYLLLNVIWRVIKPKQPD
jgi:hypothetical protein